MQYLVETVRGLLLEALVGQDALDDAPAVDDVDAVVAGVHLRVGGVCVDDYRARASEEVADDLGQARPSVAAGVRRTVALELAVLQKRIGSVASAAPMQVKTDLSLGYGDDCSVFHDVYPFG